MPKKGGKIKLQFDERGALESIDLGRGITSKPTHDLHTNPPPGEYVGHTDLGKIYYYRQPSGLVAR